MIEHMNIPSHKSYEAAKSEAIERLTAEQWSMSIYRIGKSVWQVIPVGALPPLDYNSVWIEDVIYRFKE